MRQRLISWIALSFLGLALTACEDAGSCEQPPAGSAATPDEAVAFYRRAFLQRDPLALEMLLSSDFVRQLIPSDADSIGIGRQWSRRVELENATRMLSGFSGTRVDSLAQCPLDASFFMNLSPLRDSGWQAVQSGARAGLLVREYDTIGQTNVGSFGLDFIRGNHRIYVRRESAPTPECCCAPVYRIAFWDDLGYTAPAKHGFFHWSRVLARWRPDAPPPKNSCD